MVIASHNIGGKIKMRLFKENKILISIILVAVVVSSVISIGRINVESKNNSLDIVVDYNELEQMAKQSDHDMAWWLDEFKKMGINKVGLSEESLHSLMDSGAPVETVLISDINKEANWKSLYPKEVIAYLDKNGLNDYDVLISAKTPDEYDFIAKAVSSRYDNSKFKLFRQPNGGYVLMNGTIDDAIYSPDQKLVDTAGNGFIEKDKLEDSRITYLSLGLAPQKVKKIESAGLEIIPRTYGYSGWNGHKFAMDVLKEYNHLKKVPSYLIFSGRAVIGQDNGLKDIEKYIKDNHIVIGLVEDTTQRQNIMVDGLDQLIKDTHYQATRVFSVWDYIQNRYQFYNYKGAEEIENTFYRAATERNIRIIYFKPIKAFQDNHKYITDAQVYKDLFKHFEARIAGHGITIGKAAPMGYYFISRIFKLIIALGSIAASVVLLNMIIPLDKKAKGLLFVLGALGACAAYVIAPNLAPVLTSFGASVVYPSLAICYLVSKGRDYTEKFRRDENVYTIFNYSLKTFIITALISLVGAVATSSAIADTNFLLEIDIFRGVKVAQLIPIGVFILVYLAYFGYERALKESRFLEGLDIKTVLNSSIKIWVVMVGVILLAVGYIYLARTGNETSVKPSEFEMIARNLLENHLLARPRTKEFLFAFPAAILFIYSLVRRFKILPFIFGLTVVIGQTSIVNSFMHIRTPMYMGFVRTGYSVIIGIFIGLIYLLILELIYKLIKKMEREQHA